MVLLMISLSHFYLINFVKYVKDPGQSCRESYDVLFDIHTCIV